MYDFFEGIVASKSPELLVINVSGVGYALFVSQKTLESCPHAGERVKILAHLLVREDAMTLYGFSSVEEREMFKKLIAVTRVGPKLALSILSILSPTDLAIAVMTGDMAALTQVPGIGKKAAERIVLELKEKVAESMNTAVTVEGQAGAGDAAAEAIHALVSLGYSSAEAARAVTQAGPESMDVEKIVLTALKKLGEKLG
ncbi:MAG: Holliday junction branch migration protein RuvA [Bacillota bacterium]